MASFHQNNGDLIELDQPASKPREPSPMLNYLRGCELFTLFDPLNAYGMLRESTIKFYMQTVNAQNAEIAALTRQIEELRRENAELRAALMSRH